MYNMTQPHSNQLYAGMMKNIAGKQYIPYQGVPQVPFQGQHIQTQPFQPLEGHPRVDQQGYVDVGYQNPPYFGAQVHLYHNPPYTRTQVHISQAIPSYPGYHPPDFNQ